MKGSNINLLFLFCIFIVTSCATVTVPDTPAIVMVVDEAVSPNIRFSMILYAGSQPIGVDYGDGKIVIEHPDLDIIQRELKGEVVTIYAEPNNISVFSYHSNSLRELDVTKCRQLLRLQCIEGQLETLDLSQNTELQYLYCEQNKLTALNLSANVGLREVNCSNNKLTSLEIIGCKKLESVYCQNNELTVLDISTCESLGRLYCAYNQLLTLNISNNSMLKVVDYSHNPMTNISAEEKNLLQNLVGFKKIRIIKDRIIETKE